MSTCLSQVPMTRRALAWKHLVVYLENTKVHFHCHLGRAGGEVVCRERPGVLSNETKTSFPVS